MAQTKSATSIDTFIAGRIVLRRKEIEMSQETLGQKIGVSFQQIQKYENASNRVSASRLQSIAQALGKHVAWFFPPDIEGV